MRQLVAAATRRQLVAKSCAVAAAVYCAPALSANAWCGGYFPGKISNDVEETAVPFASEFEGAQYRTNLFVRVVRPPRRRVYGSSSATFASLPPLPPVLVVGCPAVHYEYCENLEAIALSGRRVIMVNTCEAPLDAERQQWMPPPPPPGPRAMRRPKVAAAQLMTVLDALGIGKVHVVAHGLGGAAALHLAEVLTSRSAACTAGAVNGSQQTVEPPVPCPELASLVLVSPYGALEDLKLDVQRRLSGFDSLVPLDDDDSDVSLPAEGQQCVVEASLLTGMPWRDALLRPTRAEANDERLGGGRLALRLPDPSVPTLLVRGGTADAVEPSWDLRSRPDVRERDYAFSGHLPFIDRREEFLFELLDFYDQVDGSRTPRAGLADGRA